MGNRNTILLPAPNIESYALLSQPAGMAIFRTHVPLPNAAREPGPASVQGHVGRLAAQERRGVDGDVAAADVEEVEHAVAGTSTMSAG